jgi:hypothetical protein
VADLTAISEALGVSTAYFYNLSKPAASAGSRAPMSGALYLESGITDVLASPTIAGAFAMLDSHLEPGATSGEAYLSDVPSRAASCSKASSRYGWTRASRDPARQRLLPAATHAQFRYANLTEKTTRALGLQLNSFTSQG